MKINRQSAVLLIPMSIAWALDGALTLAFQPASYWAGDYSRADEFTAVFHFLLVRHPLAYVAGAGADLVFWSSAVLAVRPRIGRYLAMILTVVHMQAASDWVWLNPPLGGTRAYWALSVAMSVCLMACLERSIHCQQDEAGQCRAKGPGNPPSGRSAA